MRILFLGDIVGNEGRRVIRDGMPLLKDRYAPDVIIANGENAAGGVGTDSGTAEEIFKAGVDLISGGNHTLSRKDFHDYLNSNRHRVIRPLNHNPKAPGVGAVKFTCPNGESFGLLNVLGRVFMNDLVDDPFRSLDRMLEDFAGVHNLLVDVHAEATSEKGAIGHYLDGRVSAVVGTHTHVQTADERILPKGSAFISDVGMCGPLDSILGVRVDLVLEKFTSGLPVRFEVAKGSGVVNGVFVVTDSASGRAVSIERISERIL